MKIFCLRSQIILACLLLSACDKLPIPSEIKDTVLEQNVSKAAEPDITETTPAAPVELAQKIPEEKATKKPELSHQVREPLPPIAEEPAFSKELLAVVQNWEKVPKSVFPAKPVIISVPVNFEFKTSSGQVIGSSLTPAGSEVQVLAKQDSTLIVANINNNKLRGTVDIDDTDFKQLLAYRFEMYKKNKEIRLSRESQEPVSSKINSTPKTVQSTEAVEDIPDPLDFGHGRFCICKECREQRLAKSGSLKSGFGLEP